MFHYEKRSIINCSVQELFNFHMDSNNLKAITPPNMRVTLLNEEFEPKVGAVLRLKVVQNFIPIFWEVEIDTIEKDHMIVDVALKSPFKSWKHSHIFTQIDEKRSELKDVVVYEPPLGVLGQLVNFFIQRSLEKMFAFRHKVTAEMVEEKS